METVFEPEPWTLLAVVVVLAVVFDLLDMGVEENTVLGEKMSGLGGGRRTGPGSDMEALEKVCTR
jgi:hypothetical protein